MNMRRGEDSKAAGATRQWPVRSPLVGVGPLNRDNGRHTGHRFVWGGRGHVRAVLYMSALAATRCPDC
ncbi:MAG: transposase [Polyangia bacterium]